MLHRAHRPRNVPSIGSSLVLVALILAFGGSVTSGCSSGNEAAGCTDGTACVDDADCPSGTRCSQDACTKIYCLDNGAQCSLAEVCKSKSCVGNGTSAVCWDPNKLRPEGYGCYANSDCESGLSCNTQTYSCTKPASLGEGAGCSDSEQCLPPYVCSCGQGHACRIAGALGTSCCSAFDCQAPYTCVVGSSYLGLCR